MAQRLIAAGRVDVIQPVADTQRTPQYSSLNDVKVQTSTDGGRWVALQFNITSASETHANLLQSFPKRQFVGSLLVNEAEPFNGFGGNTGSPWVDYGSESGLDLSAVNATLSVPAEEPLSGLLSASLQRAATAGGGKLALRTVDSGSLRALVANKTYDVALVSGVTGPETCWTCLFAAVNPQLAAAADGGDLTAIEALEAELRNGGYFLPLWRDHTVVASRRTVAGVAPNGFDAALTWNAEDWWKP